jgi:hypothetical protein
MGKLVLLTTLLFLVLGMYSFSCAANNDVKSTSTVDEQTDKEKKLWTVSFRGGLNGSQASFRDWQSGGVNTLSLTSSAVFEAAYRKGDWGYNHVTNLRYGQAKIDDEYRKTDDQIAIRNQFRYFFPNDAWSALFDVNFQTQFDIGKDKDNLNVISKFMAPGYLSQILGISYKPAEYFNASFGFAMKQTFVNDTTLSQRYGLRAGESFRNETGASFLLNFKKDVMENVTFTSSLETFTGFLTDVAKTDFTFTNELNAKINNYLSTNFQFVMHYNDDVIDKIQFKQVLSVGLTYRFL